MEHTHYNPFFLPRKKQYVAPNVEVFSLQKEDVIRTSGQGYISWLWGDNDFDQNHDNTWIGN